MNRLRWYLLSNSRRFSRPFQSSLHSISALQSFLEDPKPGGLRCGKRGLNQYVKLLGYAVLEFFANLLMLHFIALQYNHHCSMGGTFPRSGLTLNKSFQTLRLNCTACQTSLHNLQISLVGSSWHWHLPPCFSCQGYRHLRAAPNGTTSASCWVFC